MSGEESTRELETQREDVRQAAADLVRGAVEALDGTASHTRGGFDGCESAFPDEFRSYQYNASGRVDVGPGAARPFLDALGPVLTAAGFEEPVLRERPGGQSLVAEKGQIVAGFSEFPEQGDYVLVNLRGPCVEVPKDDRDKWLNRRDPSPYL
ncbi:hypothetical protein LQ940_05840 [Nocardioides sp. cx-173]|uniref:hypothetical protein n=1 Tax=Nocardioides sp. cx-173 TaxID=2898796 RepID=UPI001E38866E|nr:hypothetical protein [Nocardioides sp. cx-173]UGB43043.1 hypothetical protein LQ940_05840 [Nocardioides sp. cx-173]